MKSILQILMVLSLFLFWGGCLSQDLPTVGHDRTPPSQDVEYSISAVTYGISPNLSRKKFVKKGKGKVDRQWMLWLVESDQKKIVIDPGIKSEEVAKKANIKGFVRPDVALQEAGVEAKDVTDVLFTHFHDHAAGAASLFPNAKFYVQAAAFELARKWIVQGQAKKRSIDPEAIAFLESMDKSGRLVRMDVSFELFKGLKVHAHHIHTKWYSYYSVNSSQGVFVIPGIVVPYWRDFEAGRIIPSGKERVLKNTYETMRILTGGKIDHILPGVDPEIKTKFEKTSANVYRVVN